MNYFIYLTDVLIRQNQYQYCTVQNNGAMKPGKTLGHEQLSAKAPRVPTSAGL